MNRHDGTRATRPRALVFVVLTAVVAVVGLVFAINRPTDDPLFHDPMADAQSAGATRIYRSVQHPHGQTATNKPAIAKVGQRFLPPSDGAPALAVRDDLIRQAKNGGWNFRADPESGQYSGTSAAKTIDGREAKLSINVAPGARDEVTLILERP